MVMSLLFWICLSAHLSSAKRLMRLDEVNVTRSQSWETHPCYRECNGTPKECHFNFTIHKWTTMNVFCGKCPIIQEDCETFGCIPGGGHARQAIVVNHQLPGPAIHVCEGDTIIVSVENKLASTVTSIHWHGMHQEGTPYMDGTPFITQSPIPPYEGFRYEFTASPSGTHMWHSHTGFQDSDGLFGALIVRRKETENVTSLYDFDLPEHTLNIFHWFHTLTEAQLSTALHLNLSVNGHTLLINGKGAHSTFTDPDMDEMVLTTPRETFYVTEGKRYRFRSTFNSPIYCPVQVSLDDHELTMLSSESTIIEPVPVDSFMMNSGERYDFILEANQSPGCYVMRFRAMGDCGEKKTKVHQEAFVCYPNSVQPGNALFGYKRGRRAGKLLNPLEVDTTDYSGYSLITLTDMNSTEPEEDYASEPDQTIYLQLHSTSYDAPAYPGPWHQINNVTFQMPGVVLLTQRFTALDNRLCNDSNYMEFCEEGFCNCRYMYEAPLNSLLEIVLVDISAERDQDHPMHLHGYNFYIVASETVGKNITLNEIKRQNEEGLIPKKLNGAIAKDTFSVPSKGYSIIRVIATNPGYWLFHCHVTNHMELGMAVVLKVGTDQEMAPMLSDSTWSFFSSSSSSLAVPQLVLVMSRIIAAAFNR